jgi:hypothetical protein
MIESTEDPTTNIIERTEDYIEYENTDGKKWRVYGKCSACGLCENQPLEIPSIANEQHRRMLLDGTEESWTRTLNWVAIPGTPGACIEENFNNRKDIPITPDLVNSIEICTLEGVWINGN